MGGRGGGSGISHGGRGGASSDEGGVGGSGLTRLKRGNAASIAQALARVNPNYFLGEEWRKNCQRCVYAYELQRRGYDVEALPRQDNSVDKFITHWDDGLQGIHTGSINVGGRTPADVLANIERYMQSWGVGARGFVYVKWKAGDAHIFNAEVMPSKTKNGRPTIEFFDPQVGHTPRDSSYRAGYVDRDEYFNAADSQVTYLWRTDDKDPTDWIDYAVRKRKKSKAK